MKKQILLMIATILFLTSCAETPDEVKEDMSSYRDLQSSVSDENSQFSYIKVSDLENNAEIVLLSDLFRSKPYKKIVVYDIFFDISKKIGKHKISEY